VILDTETSQSVSGHVACACNTLKAQFKLEELIIKLLVVLTLVPAFKTYIVPLLMSNPVGNCMKYLIDATVVVTVPAALAKL